MWPDGSQRLDRRIKCNIVTYSAANEEDRSATQSESTVSTNVGTVTRHALGFIEQCKRWLQNCDDNHCCYQTVNRASSYLPPRLLHLRQRGLQLIEKAEMARYASSAKYATLSHCWGTFEVPLRLIPCRYESFMRNIETGELPLTFQHAVQVCSSLGVEWIWIDSLCIMQDGPKHKADWNLHVREMSSIYTHAYINIAASHATDGSQGLWQEQSSGLKTPIEVQIGTQRHKLLSGGTEGIGNWVLNSRAWVAQERLLSARTVHFGFSSMVFECNRTIASNDEPSGLTSWTRGDIETFSIVHQWPPFDWRISADEISHKVLVERWHSIVAWYSRCRLTFPTDRLPALAGIAQAFNDAYYQDCYCAGLFRKQLPLSLLWDVFFPEDRKLGALETYVAPSWSWKSRPGGVSFELAGTSIAEVLDISQEYIDASNPYGELAFARLQLKGLVLSLQINEESGSWVDSIGWRSKDIQVLAKMSVPYQNKKWTAVCELRWDDREKQQSEGAVLPDLLVKLLCITDRDADRKYSEFFKRGRGLLGLIVTQTKSHGTVELQYRRCGLFKMRLLDDDCEPVGVVQGTRDGASLCFREETLVLI